MTGGWRSEKRLMGKPLARVRSAERPGNAGSNTAADQIAVIEQALQQIPAEQIADVEIVVRADSAGATHDLLDFCREGRLRYSLRASDLRVGGSPARRMLRSTRVSGSLARRVAPLLRKPRRREGVTRGESPRAGVVRAVPAPEPGRRDRGEPFGLVKPLDARSC